MMEVRTQEVGGRPPEASTANDRLKAAHRRTMDLAMLTSVLVHLAFFLGLPEMRSPEDSLGSPQGSGFLELVSLSIDDAAASAGAAPKLIETTDVEEALDPETADDASVEDDSAPLGWEHLPSNLWRLAALRPELADSIREQEALPGSAGADSPDPTSRDDRSDELRIRMEAAELELQRLSEEERLSLERLSAYRPELVITSPSSWLVLRNPREVGAFLEDRLGSVGVGRDSRGSIGVAIWVDALGSVEWADIVHSSGNARVDESALEMFRTVVSFRPAREDGARVSVAALYWLMW